MGSKNIKPIHVVIAAVFLKWIAFGLTYPDCMGALVLFSGLFIQHVLEYHYPKREDVFEKLKSLEDQITDLKAKATEAEHDLTALKFGRVKK